MNAKDRRKHPRYEATMKIDLLNMGDDPSVSQTEAIVHGLAMDVSRQGMRLKVPYDVPVGSMLSIILYSQQGGESLCLCEVMWRQDERGEPVYGVFTRSWSKLDPRLARIFTSMESGASRAA